MSGEQSWPTSDQFDQAATLGTEYALQQIANGVTEPHESPLSGEWADSLTPQDVARNVGFLPVPFTTPDEDAEYFEAKTELADAWERGYNDAWAHSIESKTT